MGAELFRGRPGEHIEHVTTERARDLFKRVISRPDFAGLDDVNRPDGLLTKLRKLTLSESGLFPQILDCAPQERLRRFDFLRFIPFFKEFHND